MPAISAPAGIERSTEGPRAVREAENFARKQRSAADNRSAPPLGLPRPLESVNMAGDRASGPGPKDGGETAWTRAERPISTSSPWGPTPTTSRSPAAGRSPGSPARGIGSGSSDLTDGEPTPRSPGPDVRLEEARRAAEILGVALRVNLNLPNRRLFDTFEHRVALAKVFRRYRPKVVVGFGGKTVLASPDHYQAMLITDAAVFYSRLTKWDEYFDGLPVHTITNQLSFPIALHGLETVDAQGIVVADISATLGVKLEAIRAYETQFGARASIFAAVETMNRYHGLTAGFEAGELFLSYRPIGVDNLLHWAAPGTWHDALGRSAAK